MRSALASLASLAGTALLLTACIKLKPAPESLDVAIKSYWRAYENADDATVAGITRDLDKLVPDFIKQSRIEGALAEDGRIGLLDRDLLAEIGMQDKSDPATAQGIIVFAEIGCPLEQVEKYVIAKNQMALYPEVYTKYSRVYTTDAASYLSRATPRLGWTTEYGAELPNATTYDATILGGARWIKGTPGAIGPDGPILLARTYFPAPGRVAQEGKHWRQDYQMEAYYEREPGKTVHLYGLWRDFDLGYTMDDNTAVKFMSSNLIEFDRRTTKLCAAGTPAEL